MLSLGREKIVGGRDGHEDEIPVEDRVRVRAAEAGGVETPAFIVVASLSEETVRSEGFELPLTLLPLTHAPVMAVILLAVAAMKAHAADLVELGTYERHVSVLLTAVGVDAHSLPHGDLLPARAHEDPFGVHQAVASYAAELAAPSPTGLYW